MNEKSALTGRVLTEGIIITIFHDDGPQNVYNSSPLNETEAFSMVLKNLTAIGTEDPHPLGEVHAYGPLPTPKPQFFALAFLSHLKAKDSADVRIAQFGRVAVLWVATRSTTTAKYATVLKQMIRRLFHFYRITSDSDLLKEGIMKKIDEKLKIVEGGVEAYYITEEMSIESFLDLALVPPKVPLLLIDSENRQIQILLRYDLSAIKKTQIRQIVNDFIKEISKGTTYPIEWVSDSVKIQMMLSKLGFDLQTAIDDDFEIRLYGELAFEELDDFFASQLAPRRRQLVNRILKSVESKTPVTIQELATEVGLSRELIEQLFASAIKRGLISGARIEGGIFYPPSKG
ncbi:MAG: hypothetical protein ACFFB3_03200 [Candidatus Hodarchaeota archaeon]